MDDRFSYVEHRLWLHRDSIKAKVLMYVPHGGFITIVFGDYVMFKIATMILIIVATLLNVDTH